MNVPFMALTATANSGTKSVIIESLQLKDVELIEVNPDRENIFYNVKSRPSHGDDKLDPILKPIASMLKDLKPRLESLSRAAEISVAQNFSRCAPRRAKFKKSRQARKISGRGAHRMKNCVIFRRARKIAFHKFMRRCAPRASCVHVLSCHQSTSLRSTMRSTRAHFNSHCTLAFHSCMYIEDLL